jgi:hypothetical protein
MKSKKKPDNLRASITSPLKQVTKGWQWRERATRAVQSPIKGKDTNAKQWGRWTP